MATGGFSYSDLDKGHDETFDFLCTVCKGKNKNTEAEKYCADCCDYYCIKCVKCHDDIPVLKTHKILDKAKFKPGASVSFPAVPTQRCRTHGHKPVDMFCERHDAVGCAICMQVQHSDCKEKHYVPDYIKKNTQAANLKEITKQLDTIASSLNELKKAFIKEKETLKSNKEKSLKQIQKYRKEINQQLDELEQKTIKELQQRFQALTDKLEANLKELQTSINDIQSAQDNLKTAGGNKAQAFVSIKTAKDVASFAQAKVITSTSQVSSMDLSFVPHHKLQSILKELQDLGDITLTGTPQYRPTPADSSPLVTKNGTRNKSAKKQSKPTPPAHLQPVIEIQSRNKSSYESQSKTALLQIRDRNRYNVKVESDKCSCDIYRACTLPDGTIILADNTNNKLKRLDSLTFTVTDCCDVPNDPWQVCVISNKEVAVSCYRSSLIQFVSIGKTMQRTRQINTGFQCRGLAYADSKLFVSDDKSVYVYSLSGERLEQFSKDTSGEEIFSDIRSLTASSDHSKIIIADFEKGLIIMDKSGQVIGQYNGHELNGAISLCLYKNNSILVCGHNSWNVLQFSLDGKLLGEVLKIEKGCQAVCCNTENTKLILGFDLKNEIEVYQGWQNAGKYEYFPCRR